MSSTIFKIRGIVREKESGIGIGNLMVKAYDKDLLFDDLLGNAFTKSDGTFEILSEAEDFRDFFERRPDIYLKILTPDSQRQIYSTEHAVRWHAGRLEEFDVRIPRDLLGELAPSRGVRLLDELGRERTDFDAGESLIVQVGGVNPDTTYDIVLLDDGKELFTSKLRSDRRGVIRAANLWPQMGLEDVATGKMLSVEQAQVRWQGRELMIEVRTKSEVVMEQAVSFSDAFKRPLLLSTDKDGVIVNGFEVGQRHAVVSGYNLPIRGQARVFMVPRQHSWYPGDPITPVQLASRRTAFVDVDIEDGSFRATIAQAGELRSGAYDFVVRQLRYGYEDDEDLVLWATDFVTGAVTGLVVREEFMASKTVLGGCANAQKEMVGRRISGKPYFQFADTFQVGEDIYAALDPAALDPNLVGKMFALYVVEHKTSAEWNADTGLNHLPELGGNAAVQEFKTQPGCINYNDHLIWEDAQKVGEYDVVADFGNDSTDPNLFNRDDSFDQPIDIIDGYFVAGFRIVKDPTTLEEFVNAGTFDYTSADEGWELVDDDYGVPENVPMNAEVYFPADDPGKTESGDISSTQTSYPVVVIVHGNGHNYRDYSYLLEHFAKNGFIAASIHLNGGMYGTGRARVLFKHLDILKTRFGTTMANNIGIMGHSRGGEAVTIAPRVNQTETLGHNINAIISLAPTDRYTNEILGGDWATPYFVLYGSMDGDVAGGAEAPMHTGFSLYDRANGASKSLAFVYGATHNRFRQTATPASADSDMNSYKMYASDRAKVVNQEAHHKIAKAYMNAFFRWHLKNEPHWNSLFRGAWIPAEVAQADPGKLEIYIQYEDTDRTQIDNFEEDHSADSWKDSTIWQEAGLGSTTAGHVEDDDTLPDDPVEDELYDVDSNSPHDTSGLLLHWDGLSDKLRFKIPPAHKNVETYDALSFRVTQKAYSNENPPGDFQDFYVTLTDDTAPTPKSRSVKVSKLAAIPPPHERYYSQYTKSAMCTVRIPLHVFEIEVAGADRIDLTNVMSITFDFKTNIKGEIEIDSVEFTK